MAESDRESDRIVAHASVATLLLCLRRLQQSGVVVRVGLGLLSEMFQQVLNRVSRYVNFFLSSLKFVGADLGCVDNGCRPSCIVSR